MPVGQTLALAWQILVIDIFWETNRAILLMEIDQDLAELAEIDEPGRHSTLMGPTPGRG